MMAHTTRRRVPANATRGVPIDSTQLRRDIIEEARLRNEIADEEERKRMHPDAWRMAERVRVEWNHRQAEINARLTSLGLAREPLLPSLAQRRQRMKRLQASIAAAVAALPRAHGTRVAPRKAR